MVLENLSIGYERQILVENISIHLKQGESLLVIGHNGAGKSTLLKTIFNLIPSLGGNVSYKGVGISEISIGNLLRDGCRYLSQGTHGFDQLSVLEHRNVLKEIYGFQVATTQSASNFPLNRRFGELSLGERRLELIQLLFSGDPLLLLLDEPTAGLDLKNRASVTELLRKYQEEKTSFIIIEHNFKSFLDFIDKTLIVRRGEVSFYGDSKELKDEEFLASVFL